MIEKEAGLENSGIVDSEHGKAILVSTTARMFFRKQFPGAAKVRNNIVNQYIAKMFSEGYVADYFRPKNTKAHNSGDVGEIRTAGGAKFVGIISGDSVRVIAVKGSVQGTFPALPVDMGGQAPNPIEEALKK